MGSGLQLVAAVPAFALAAVLCSCWTSSPTKQAFLAAGLSKQEKQNRPEEEATLKREETWIGVNKQFVREEGGGGGGQRERERGRETQSGWGRAPKVYSQEQLSLERERGERKRDFGYGRRWLDNEGRNDVAIS